MDNIFFIIGAFRSGTTAIAKIFDLAPNAAVHIEQPPKLSREARDLYDGRLTNPVEVLKKSKQNHIAAVLKKGLIYGDKNANYLPFIPYLLEIWNCKTALIIRDGRDVVRSMLEWEQVINSQFYKRHEDSNEFPLKPVEDDYWDYSLIRPKPDNPYYDKWKQMSHFEKLCWYWANYNRHMLTLASMFTKDKYKIIYIDRMNSSHIKDLYSFLNLSGFNEKQVDKLIRLKINTSVQRGEVRNQIPSWRDWSDDWLKKFEKIAAPTMKKLGYYE